MVRDNEIITSFERTIFSNCVDISKEFIEIAIDEVIGNEIITKIPIVSTLIGIGNIALSLKDLFFVKKTLVFAQKLNKMCLSAEEIENHKEYLNINPKRKIEELEFVMALIDKEINYEKVELISILYYSYISKNIICDWYDFKFCYDILDRLSIYDIRTLFDIRDGKICILGDQYDKLAITRLSNNGLVDFRQSRDENIVMISELGKVFFELAISGYAHI